MFNGHGSAETIGAPRPDTYARPLVKQRHDTEATRAELLTSARAAFATGGYAGSGTEDIVARYGLTRGALYHHFGSKLGLFEAVVEDLQAELADEVKRRARRTQGDHVDKLRAGFRTYLDFALRPDFRQILLVDGPAVLGWERWHEIDFRHAFGATRAALDAAIAGGELDAAPVDELAHVLLGAVTQAGLEIGRSTSPKDARRRYGAVVDLVLDSIRR